MVYATNYIVPEDGIWEIKMKQGYSFYYVNGSYCTNLTEPSDARYESIVYTLVKKGDIIRAEGSNQSGMTNTLYY